MLVAGDKSGQRERWYRTAIPRAEQLYDDYLAEPPDLGGYPVPHAQRDSIGR